MASRTWSSTSPRTHQDMVPQLFAPLFITGEPEWRDYTVEVSVCPLSTAEFAGVVFRYHTNRHHIVFSIENGKTARLAKRLPLEEKFRVCSWQELGTADFPYETNRYYRLRVENDGPANPRVHRRQAGAHGHATTI